MVQQVALTPEATHECADMQSGDVHAPAPSSAREGHDHRCAWFRRDRYPAKALGFTLPLFVYPSDEQ